MTSKKSDFSADNVAPLGLADGHLTSAGLEIDSAHPNALREVELQSYIGRELRAIYDDVLNEDIPESLLLLIEDLQHKQAQKS